MRNMRPRREQVLGTLPYYNFLVEPVMDTDGVYIRKGLHPMLLNSTNLSPCTISLNRGREFLVVTGGNMVMMVGYRGLLYTNGLEWEINVLQDDCLVSDSCKNDWVA